MEYFVFIQAMERFLLFCQCPPDICSLCEHAGVEGNFGIEIKKRFLNDNA